MSDAVFQDFLARQYTEAQELAAGSDALELLPLRAGAGLPDRYLAKFACNGALRSAGGTICIQPAEFVVGIAFPRDYLRHIEPMRIVTWLEPANIVHPNVKPPWICLGRICAGTSLVDLLYQTFEIITYRNFAAQDALDSEAAEWARHNQHLFPIDRRTLKRRTAVIHVETPTPPERAS